MQESAARRTITPALEPGEQVQWCGAPVAGRIATRRLGGLLLRLGVFAAVVYWLIPSSHESTGADVGTLFHSLVQAASRDARLLVPAGVSAAVLLGLLARLVLDRRRLSHTAYAITDRRLLAVVGLRGKVPWSIGPEQVAYVKVRGLGGGMGDVRFNHYRQGRGSRNTNRLYTFERLEDPDRLARRARTWLAEREPAAVAEARDLRRVTDRDLGFELQVPASWREGPAPDEDTSFHVLSESSGVRSQEAEKSRHVLALYGPLGAALALEVAPAGTWTLEQTEIGAHGLARLFLTVVEGPEKLRDGPAPGFRVTCQTRRVQRMRDVLEDVVRSLEPVTSRRA